MTAMGNVLYNSLSESMKYDLWLLGAVSFTTPYQNHCKMTYGCQGQLIWAMTAMGHFLYNSLSKSSKYDLWRLWTISITIHYQNHWNMTYDCCEPFPVHLLIKSIEIWRLTTRDNFLYISLSKSLKYNLWLSWAISYTIPYQMIHKRTRWDY